MKKKDSLKHFNLSKDAFNKLEPNLQSFVLIRLIDYSITKPEGLALLKSLSPNPEQHFTQELLEQKQGAYTTKQNILVVLRKHLYSITNANEENLINSLKYLFSDNRLSIKDFLLDKFVNFNKILVNLLANNKTKLVKYLLEDKTNEEYTFKDQITLKNENYNKYSIHDIFGNQFPKKLKQYLEQNYPTRSDANQSVKEVIQNHYKEEVEDYLSAFQSSFVAEKEFIELIYLLFNFNNNDNVKSFLGKLPKVYTKNDLNNSVKATHLNAIVNIFNQVFLYNIDISHRISFFEFIYSLNQKDKDRELSLKLNKDIQKLINYKIIDPTDYEFQKKATVFLVHPEGLGFVDGVYAQLSNKAANQKDGIIFFTSILADYLHDPLNQLQAYVSLGAHYLNSSQYNEDKVNEYTEKAVLLANDCKKQVSTNLKAEVNIDIRNAYWNRAAYYNQSANNYYNKSANNMEAIEFFIKFLELVNKEDLNNHLDSIKIIINCCIAVNKNSEKSQEYINRIYEILFSKETNVKNQKLFNEIVNGELNIENIEGYLKEINSLPSSNNIALIVCKDILSNYLSSIQEQKQDVGVTFSNSYLHLAYEEGKKHFSLDNAYGSDLLQATIFYIKYEKFQEAEKYLAAAENRYKSNEQLYSNKLKSIFSNLHLNLALHFIEQGALKNQTIIDKHLKLAKELNPFLNLVAYYLALDIKSNKINEQEIQKNNEIQSLIEDNLLEDTGKIDPVYVQCSNQLAIARTDQEVRKVEYQKAAKRFLEEQKRKSANIISSKNEDYSWTIDNITYSTKDKGIVDLGYGKYCIIDLSLHDLERYETYQKSMEKGFISRVNGQNRIKLAGNTCEIKICTQDYRLHNNNIVYINPEGKKLILFNKEASHKEISAISTAPVRFIKVDSSSTTDSGLESGILEHRYGNYNDEYHLKCLGDESADNNL